MSSPDSNLPGEARAAVAAALEQPEDVARLIAAAYACDRAGDEERAIEFYDAAWRLGVPEPEAAEFVIGYGSTLRNVGRCDEARDTLAAFLGEHPDDAAARCFHALALHSGGEPAAALAELLHVALSLAAVPPGLARYQRALTEYQAELRAEPPSRFQRVAPVLPTRDVHAALERYRRLGFEAEPYSELVYGFLRRGNVSLHLARVDDVDPRTTTSAVYVYVDDADAVHAEWTAAGVEGRLTAPITTDYEMREFAYVDPDGNLLRVGSRLAMQRRQPAVLRSGAER